MYLTKIYNLPGKLTLIPSFNIIPKEIVKTLKQNVFMVQIQLSPCLISSDSSVI